MRKEYMDFRETILKEYIKDKEVLDFWAWDIRDRFLHKFLTENSRSVTWVELMDFKIENMRKHGYDIIQWDAENVDLGRKFDVIVAWDLIEHLNNPWLFIENVKRHLKDDGYFIFNTPNIYSFNLLLRWLILWWNVAQFPEHVIWYNEDLLRELLSRYDLKIERVEYFTHNEWNLLSKIIWFFWAISKKWHGHILFVVKING